jgi:hypothetical protein
MAKPRYGAILGYWSLFAAALLIVIFGGYLNLETWEVNLPAPWIHPVPFLWWIILGVFLGVIMALPDWTRCGQFQRERDG